MPDNKTLYISDLDGTLLNRNAELTGYAKNTLNAMIRNGLNFTVATARSATAVSAMLDGLELKLPVGLLNGVMLYDLARRKYVKVNAIEPETAVKMLRTFKKCGCRATGFVYEFNNGEILTYHESSEQKPLRDFVEERITRYNKNYTHTCGFESMNMENIIYFTLMDTYEKLHPIYESFEKLPGLHLNYYHDYYNPDLWLLEMSSAGASKKGVVDYLRAEYGFERVIGFGDSSNDLSMFEVCDVCVAVENANSEVKAAADFLCGSNEQNGVVKWLENNKKIG
ncbi:MAG: HAD family hydrolase [Oscillospiraceae bacterium]|nr:HAD family hydrolase [Oscillospiraceae bacterium]